MTLHQAIVTIYNTIASSDTLFEDVQGLKSAGMGTLYVEGDQLVITIIIYKPENLKASTQMLKTLVNEGIVLLEES